MVVDITKALTNFFVSLNQIGFKKIKQYMEISLTVHPVTFFFKTFLKKLFPGDSPDFLISDYKMLWFSNISQ